MSEGRGSRERKGVGHFWTPHFLFCGSLGNQSRWLAFRSSHPGNSLCRPAFLHWCVTFSGCPYLNYPPPPPPISCPRKAPLIIVHPSYHISESHVRWAKKFGVLNNRWNVRSESVVSRAGATLASIMAFPLSLHEK